MIKSDVPVELFAYLKINIIEFSLSTKQFCLKKYTIVVDFYDILLCFISDILSLLNMSIKIIPTHILLGNMMF